MSAILLHADEERVVREALALMHGNETANALLARERMALLLLWQNEITVLREALNLATGDCKVLHSIRERIECAYQNKVINEPAYVEPKPKPPTRRQRRPAN